MAITASSITDFNLNKKTGEMSFKVAIDTSDFCKVITSKWLLNGAFNFLIDNVPATWSMTWDSEFHMINFTISPGTHNVIIVGESTLRFDLNGDGIINILDIATLAIHFGETLED